jgi:hypothetical protein
MELNTGASRMSLHGNSNSNSNHENTKRFRVIQYQSAMHVRCPPRRSKGKGMADR